MSAPIAQVDIRPAQPADAAWMTGVLADAFLIAPVGDWLIPDLGERRLVYWDYFAIFVAHGLAFGIVEVTDDRRGVAIWLPRDDNTPGPVDYAAQLAAACGPYTDRFRTLDATFDEHHPRGRGFHHYLQFLAVAPGEQSRGIGSALLQHHHTWLDRDGIPAYLEASKTGSRDLYLHHNYVASDPFYLPHDGPPLWPMQRAPQHPKVPRC